MLAKLKEKLGSGAARLNGKADLLEGICAICVRTGAADGDFSDDEAGVALDRLLNHEVISVAFSMTQIETAFDKQARRAKQGMSGRVALRREIEEMKGKSTTDDLEMALMIGIDVAMADGDISTKEKAVLEEIGKILGFDLNRYLS